MIELPKNFDRMTFNGFRVGLVGLLCHGFPKPVVFAGYGIFGDLSVL
jgi:hypothetical protein